MKKLILFLVSGISAMLLVCMPYAKAGFFSKDNEKTETHRDPAASTSLTANVASLNESENPFMTSDSEILKNVIARMLFEDMQKAVDDYYSKAMSRSPQIEVYSSNSSTKITDIDFVKNHYLVTVEVQPYIGAHNPVGRDKIIFAIDCCGAVDLVNFTHGNTELPPWLKDGKGKPFSKETG